MLTIGRSGSTAFASVLMNGGGGIFEAFQLYAAGSNVKDTALADVDSDGDLDLITTNFSSSSELGVLLNLGDGSFSARTGFAVGQTPREGLRIADIDGDGRLDIVTANQLRDSFRVLINRCEWRCPADVTDDGSVGLADLNLVLANFGQASSDGDTSSDGNVDLVDLNAVLAAFGAVCGEVAPAGSFRLRGSAPGSTGP